MIIIAEVIINACKDLLSDLIPSLRLNFNFDNTSSGISFIHGMNLLTDLVYCVNMSLNLFDGLNLC